MGLKTCILSFLLLFSLAASAQDQIVRKKGGVVIYGKVTAVSATTISYKRKDNPDGPSYTIPKSDLVKVTYQNGTTDSFLVSDHGIHRRGKNYRPEVRRPGEWGSNMIAVIPGAYTLDLNGFTNDPGLGLSYERLVDGGGHIGAGLTALVNFVSDRDFQYSNYNYNYNYNNTVIIPTTRKYTSLTLMPGFKFYPSKISRIARYAIGASFFTTFGQEPYYIYNANSSSAADHNYLVYGFMISNSVNITAAKHFYMALDLNTGMPLSDNRRSDGGDALDKIFDQMIQFILKVGYRF